MHWSSVALLTLALAPLSLSKKLCVVPSLYKSSNGTADDTRAIQAVFNNCTSDAIIQFSNGTDYNLFNRINATGLNNVDIQIAGNIHLSQNLTAVQTIVNATNGVWITIQGNGVNLSGSKNITQGWIYSYGSTWWNANPKNGTGLIGRPHLMTFNVTNGSMIDMKLKEPIAWVFLLYGNNLTVRNTFIDASTKPGGGFPFNTDGFDVYASNTIIEDFVIQNGDDAVTIENGASNVTVRHGTVGGPGSHGMSVGSLGQNQATYNRVQNILFDDITMTNSVYGARFKSWIGGQGLVTNVTWSNFRVQNVSFPVFVQQNYFNQGSAQTQIESGAVQGRVNNASVIMDGFNWVNWTGTINTYNHGDWSCVTDPCWYDAGLPNEDSTQSIVITCTNTTTCNNFVTKNINVIPQSLAAPKVICLNAGVNSPSLGFDCKNGTYVPLA